MVVKSKRGRRRYVAFVAETDKESLKSAMARASRGRGVPSPRIIQFDDGIGIVRCGVPDRDTVVAMLNSEEEMGFEVRTLRVSGTLRSLRERYPPL